MNKVILVGRLGGDPETRYTPNGKMIARFSLATSEKFTDKTTGERRDETQWHRIEAWGKLADICSQYLRKGNRIFVEGKLVYRKWQDSSGTNRTAANIRMLSMQMLDGKQANNGTQTNAYEDEDIPF